MRRRRVISFIDGFNLYHALDNLERPELKWLNLMTLSQMFLKSYSEELVGVFYFSAYADHMSEPAQKRQKAYVRALELKGVKTILGHFKKKNRRCPECRHSWTGHEEKETDVNIALFLLDLAYQNVFDRALVISNDSDLAPAIKMTRNRFPDKRITTVVPPNFYHSNELIKVSSDKTKIRVEQLERSLLPPVVTDASHFISISRPLEYAPHSLTSAPKT
jgi:uncharacterized LabA/DUF88 family protein